MLPSIMRTASFRERLRRLRRSAWLLSFICVVGQVGAGVMHPTAHASAAVEARLER